MEESCSEETGSLQYGESGNIVVSMPVSKACCVRVKAMAKWRGSEKGAAKQSERSELSKKQHLPQAIHALIKQGLPEQEAVRQLDELLLKFGITMIRAKFDAFLWRQQTKIPKKRC